MRRRNVSVPGHENRRPRRHGRPWQLVVAELAINAGRGAAPAAEGGRRCACPLCDGALD